MVELEGASAEAFDNLRRENLELRQRLVARAAEYELTLRQLAAAEAIVTRVRIVCQDEGERLLATTKLRLGELLGRYDAAFDR